ncbi:MAG: ABC transporter ATP-binding protein/permease [Lachnospiraceae bacterium]|nr:ABC transporter ATP-binding protein/permease [Lachnospiraceae bacterium]
MKRYWKYIKPYLSAFIIGPLLMIVEVVGEIVLPKLMSLIINNGIVDKDVSYIVRIGLAMIACAVFMAIGGVGGAYFGAKASINFAADLRKDAFENVQRFSFKNIDNFSTGSLVTRLTNDITQVMNFVNQILRMALRAPGMLIGAVIMAVMMNARLALIILIVIPIMIATILFVISKAFPRFQALQKKIDNLNSVTREAITNVRVIKSFVRDDHEHGKFAETNEELKESSLAAFRIMITTFPLMALFMNVTTLAVVWFGGNQILVGDMQVGDLTAFITYVTQILISLMMTSIMILQSSRAIASAKRINEVIDCETDIDDANAACPDKKVEKGSIEFKNITFRYYKESKEPVLENVSLKIASGETVGIIGSTGSGKTTLVQMIPRLYDVDEGEVLVDGVNVKDYSLKNLRDGVSMVLQKNLLFSGSIIENLKWGDEEASDEEIRKVADMAQADGFVTSFEDGYDTDLGQGGVNVSGGQKQRLCIARAMLKKPKILILDDSTSAVDTATERYIRDNLKSYMPETTKIIIAQRISSVIEADKIVVLDDGRVVGEGTHDQLMSECEAYKEIYYSQMDKKEVGA